MTLRDLNMRHEGQTAYIIATGPSLDTFDWDVLENDGFQIVIHRAIGVCPILPDRTYWQVLDDAWGMGVPGPWGKWLDMVKGDSGVYGLFRDPLMKQPQPCTPAPIHPHIVRFKGPMTGETDVLDWPRSRCVAAGKLYCYAGSACTAVHAAWLMGASEAILVGCDGGQQNAACLAQWYDQPKDDSGHPTVGGFGYNMRQAYGFSAAEQLGLVARHCDAADCVRA